MASRSSQHKLAPRLDPEHVRLLLEDGGSVEQPTSDLIAVAQHLQSFGLISFKCVDYVKCTDPQDRDFSGRKQPCPGQIVLEAGKDEAADDYECPRCRRVVYPARHDKQRHEQLQTALSRSGAARWLGARLREVSSDVRNIADGAFHVGGFGDLGVVVYPVDADGRANSTFNTRDFAARSPVLYVTLNPKVAEGRFLKDEWLCRVGLTDLLCGVADLRQVLTKCAASTVANSATVVDIPVYASGHVIVQPVEEPHVGRLFVVEVDSKVVRVNGEIVINPQAGPRLALFGILWSQFLRDLADGKPPGDFGALNMAKLLKAMENAGKRYDDETSLRKVVNNLQTDIEIAVKKKLGLPIGPQDIVQTCRTTSQADTSGGYRVNPYCVAIRPAQAR